MDDKYDPGDACLVVWADGSIYAGVVQKRFDPIEDVVYSRRRDKSVQAGPASSDPQWRAEKTVDSPEGIEVGGEMLWYRVHYRGWKSQYDDWVPHRRMLVYNPENVALMDRVNAARKAQLAEPRRSSRPEKSVKTGKSAEAEKPGAKSRSRKRSHDPRDPQEALRLSLREGTGTTEKSLDEAMDMNEDKNDLHATSRKRPSSRVHPDREKRRRAAEREEEIVAVRIPLALKQILVDDWELVTKERLLLSLPRPVPVLDILDKFRAWSMPRLVTAGQRENMDEFVAGMAVYFDRALGLLLLYRFERQQYFEFRQQNEDKFRPVNLYGAEHLCRLLVSMPALLAQAQLDDKTLEYLMNECSELARFLDSHSGLFGGPQTYLPGTRRYEEAAEVM